MIYIGTSGYYYKDWVGPVYPENLKSKDFLHYYTKLFSFTELNFSYYTMPKQEQLAKMVSDTPADFLFSIKAYKDFTHTQQYSSESKEAFISAITPLLSVNKLTAVLFQFPYSFHYTKTNRYYLAKLLDDMAELPCAIEFRNSEWYKDSVIQELSKRQQSFVNVDTPQLKNLPELTTIVSNETAFLRLHGRNHENWWEGTNVSRYDYLYNESELENIQAAIAIILKQAKRLFISLNNHHKGKAVKNGQQLEIKLKEAGYTLAKRESEK